MHILFELVAFICILVGVCDDKHGCKFGSHWAFAFSVSVIRFVFVRLYFLNYYFSLVWWPFLILNDKFKCLSWGGLATLEKIMWFILYHFVYAAAIITISWVNRNSLIYISGIFWRHKNKGKRQNIAKTLIDMPPGAEILRG